MSIVFYEIQHCEKILKEGVPKLYQRDLNYLAKYWEYLGFNYTEIRKMIIDFCIKNDGRFNEIQSYKMINKSISHARNNFLRHDIAPITISFLELEKIKSLNDYSKEKFMFSMLVCARFFDEHPVRKKIGINKYNNILYADISYKDICELANIKITKNKWNEWKREFTLLCLISPTILDSNCWAMGFNKFSSGSGIVIDDYRNIIGYYQEFHGEKMTHCRECGVLINKGSNRQAYCKDCWNERKNEIRKESSKKYYEKTK